MLCNVVGQMKGQPKVSFCAGDLILEQFGSSSFTSLCPCFLKSPCGMGLLYLQNLFLSNPLSRPCPQANSKYLTYCPPSPLLCFPFFFLFFLPLARHPYSPLCRSFSLSPLSVQCLPLTLSVHLLFAILHLNPL